MDNGNEWVGMKEEVLKQVETGISNYSGDNCLVENYIVSEFISALRTERQKVVELEAIVKTQSQNIDIMEEQNTALHRELEAERTKVAELRKILHAIHTSMNSIL
jgi:hypothetical protein